MNKKYVALFVIAFYVIYGFIQCKSAPNMLIPQLNSYLEKQVYIQSGTSGKVEQPGLSIIITKKDSVLYVGNFGVSDLDNSSLITENTVFDIASLSKQFTGMAVAILESEGKLDLSDKVVKYIPELPEVFNDITLYQLVHHSSGIRDWPILFGLKGWKPDVPLTLDNIYDLLKKQESLNFTPGTEFSYSNSNYNLLAKVIESVTATKFDTWMNDFVFTPLDMKTTYVDKNEIAKEESIAKSYYYTGESYLPFSNNLNAPGSSSIHSNASNMAKWMINFYNKALGGNDAIAKMTQKGSLSDGTSISYGYGLYIAGIKNKKAFLHDGTWGGYRSGTAYFPEDSIGVVFLSNNGIVNPKKIMNGIVDILFSSELEKESNSSDMVEKEVNEEFFKLCAGKYQQVDDKNCYLTFYKDNDDYFVNVYNRNLKLYAKSDSVFYIKEAKAEFVFHLENGKVNSHSLEQNGNSYLAVKVVDKQKEVNINYNNLPGIYYSRELDIKFEIRYLNDELTIHSPLFSEAIILEHSEGLTFISNSGLVQSVSFVNKNSKTQSLRVNNPRAKNLVFEKKD